MNATTTMETATIEQATCTRCSGTGRHSFCTAHGHTCFKCHGRGYVLTKRGSLVAAYVMGLRWKETPAGEITEGQIAILSSSPFSSASRSYRVLSVNVEGGWATFTTNDRQYPLSVSDRSLVKVRTAATDAETLAAGLAIQSTLTKAGKPTKATPAAFVAWLEAR